MTRRALFAAMAAPFFRPPQSLFDLINDGINPDWDGTVRHAELDEISIVTRDYFQRVQIATDNFFGPLLSDGPIDGGTYIQESIKYV